MSSSHSARVIALSVFKAALSLSGPFCHLSLPNANRWPGAAPGYRDVSCAAAVSRYDIQQNLCLMLRLLRIRSVGGYHAALKLLQKTKGFLTLCAVQLSPRTYFDATPSFFGATSDLI